MTHITEYRLPPSLSRFQEKLYKHLIDYKRDVLGITEPGLYGDREYDAVLPEAYAGKLPHLYEPVRELFLEHQTRFHFKTHKFADHMASSQIACANLFLPIMANPEDAPSILRSVKPDMDSIATEELDNGFRIEFWDEDPEGPDGQIGMLGDHNRSTGTDSDFAIAYRNRSGELCLWLIEHKLTEAEFTTCGGAKSKGRKYGHYSCDSTVDLMQTPGLCYYQGKCGYNYWALTLLNGNTFPRKNLLKHATCPFKGGMNQLWRNTVLALAIENATKGPYAKYKHVHFSVCHHPGNKALNASMGAYRDILGEDVRFSSFTSRPLVKASMKHDGDGLRNWAKWYSELYLIGE